MIINKRRLGWCFLGLIPLFLSPACGPREPGWQGRVEVHDGVTVVMNPAIPLYPDAVLELEDDLTIAGSEEDEQQILQNIVILDVDTGGRIYVLDEQAGNIKLFGPETYDVFDSDGRYAARVRLEVPLMVLKKGFLYTIVENPDGFREAKRYKMRWSREF